MKFSLLTFIVLIYLVYASNPCLLENVAQPARIAVILPKRETAPHVNLRKKIIAPKLICEHGVFVAGKCKIPDDNAAD